MGELTLAPPTLRHAVAHRRSFAWVPLLCTVAAALLWVVTVRRANFASMGPLGLVTILGPSYYLGLLVLCVGLGVELVRGRPRERWLAALVVGLVVYLFGTASAVEPIASLASSWVHAGYVQYVYQHGSALNNFDAEFSWPGTFSMFAVIVSFMGKSNAILLLRWFPLGIELAYLPPLVAITRALGVSRRVAWLGIALFYGTDWIYQDYFSPQAVNFLFYLVVLAVVLTCWKPLVRSVERARPSIKERFGTLRDAVRVRRLRGDEAVAAWPPRLVLGAFFALVLIFAASAMSHQLTPYAIVLGLAACLVTRRLGRPELPLIAFLLAVGWLSLGASNYWLGHLSQIFGNFFSFVSTASQNVSSRVTGSASHRYIVDARILLTVSLFGLAALGAARRAATTRTMELLTVAPFLVLAGQSYGGEGLLRVALLSGPFAALLAASAVFPATHGPIRPILRSWRLGRTGRRLLVGVVALGLFGATVAMTAVRGGNDYYESFSVGELNAVNFIYLPSQVRPGHTVAIVAPYEPLGQWGVGSVNITGPGVKSSVPSLSQVVTSLLLRRPSYVLLGQAQAHWGEELAGYPTGWPMTLASVLVHNHYVEVLNTPSAIVLRLPNRYNPT